MKKGKDMEEIKESIKELLKEVEYDQYADCKADWQGRAVAVLNEYSFETDRYGNAVAVSGSDMLGMLKDAMQEMEDE